MTIETKIEKFYFVDEDPNSKEKLQECRLMLGPDSGQLGVCQCQQETYIPEGSILIVLEVGDAVSVSESTLYQAVICQLVAPAEFDHVFGSVDEETISEHDYLEIPPHLTGYTIPEGGEWTADHLSPFNISINLARMTDEEGNVRSEYRKDSIWKKLGRKSRDLFS